MIIQNWYEEFDQAENFKMVAGVRKMNHLLELRERVIRVISIDGKMEQYESP